MNDSLHLSWTDIDGYVSDIAASIRASGFVPDFLIGIATGGLIPLAYLSKKLGVRDVATVSARSYEGTAQNELRISNVPDIDLHGRSVLLVDEIADSGKTLRAVVELFSERGASALKTATLAVRSDKCTFRPDFFALECDRWVEFPWDASPGSVHTEASTR